jgi:hypothetical protein
LKTKPRPLARRALILGLVSLALLAVTLAPLPRFGPLGSDVPAAFADNSCNVESNAIVLKLTRGNVKKINKEYGTKTLRKFPGQSIYVVSVPRGSSALNIVSNLRGNPKVEWAETGQYIQGNTESSKSNKISKCRPSAIMGRFQTWN